MTITADVLESTRRPVFESVDRLHASWQAGARAQVSREALLERAAVELLALEGRAAVSHSRGPGIPAASVAQNTAYNLLHRILGDDSPTPQIVRIDNGIEINWLVSGDWLRADIDAAGVVVLEAGRGDSDELVIDEEFDAWEPDRAAIETAKRFLREMSENVRFRIA